MVSPFIHLSSNGDRQILCRCYEKRAWWGEGNRGSERGHVSPTLHLSPCRRLCATTDKEEKGSTTGMIRHWPRHSLLSSKPVSRWRILSYFFFTFRFLSRRRETKERRRKGERNLFTLEQRNRLMKLRRRTQSALNFHQVVNTNERILRSVTETGGADVCVKKFPEDWVLFRGGGYKLRAPSSSKKGKKKFVHILNTIEKEEGKSFSRFGKFEIQKRIIHGRKDRAARPVKKEEDHVLS